MAINKDNLVAITNSVIATELPSNVTLGRWEVERLSEAVIEKITEVFANQLLNQFWKDGNYTVLFGKEGK